MKIIIARIRVKDEHWEEAQRLAEAHSQASREEPGCISHDWFPHPSETCTIFFFEQWRDQAAIDEHFGRPHSARLVTAFREWARPPLGLQILDAAEVQEIGL